MKARRRVQRYNCWMVETLASSIRNRSLVTFTYRGKPRIVQPWVVGEDASGVVKLRGCQVGGGSASGSSDDGTPKLFVVDDCLQIEGTTTHFEVPAAYRRNDTHFASIYEQL
jgi:hypothetical protein